MICLEFLFKFIFKTSLAIFFTDKPIIFALISYRFEKSFHSLRAYLKEKGYEMLTQKSMGLITFVEYQHKSSRI